MPDKSNSKRTTLVRFVATDVHIYNKCTFIVPLLRN